MTKAELDRLHASRPVPAPELHLTPDGPEAYHVNESIVDAHEARIADLNDRLEEMRETTDRDFSLAQHDGQAKADFERTR